MSNFKLLLKTFERNKFQRNLIIAVTAAFTVYEIYLFISSITDGYTDSLFFMQITLFILYFLTVFLMFFSYESFFQIKAYKESVSICKKSITSVYKTELLLFFCYIGILTAEAIIFNVIFIIANSQFSFTLLFYTVTNLLCYYCLCLLTAVFIGLLLSGIGKKYIAYILMMIFAFSETEFIHIASKRMLESNGKIISEKQNRRITNTEFIKRQLQKNKPFTKNGLNGADYETRTRHLHLGKVALYRMS